MVKNSHRGFGIGNPLMKPRSVKANSQQNIYENLKISQARMNCIKNNTNGLLCPYKAGMKFPFKKCYAVSCEASATVWPVTSVRLFTCVNSHVGLQMRRLSISFHASWMCTTMSYIFFATFGTCFNRAFVVATMCLQHFTARD
ncbi:conserved hypothetical protein [Trichinella spiralis]|uniref:hypothetical protein n=1 Tax=Trichinella spiralis TaxID=6334 RepID=UPI0001EFE08E|nr:conserved hypothetical protein [Trichinella spiralis]